MLTISIEEQNKTLDLLSWFPGDSWRQTISYIPTGTLPSYQLIRKLDSAHAQRWEVPLITGNKKLLISYRSLPARLNIAATSLPCCLTVRTKWKLAAVDTQPSPPSSSHFPPFQVPSVTCYLFPLGTLITIIWPTHVTQISRNLTDDGGISLLLPTF